MKPMVRIETPRLVIRSCQGSDRDFCLSLWCDSENGEYMSDPVLENADEKYLSLIDEMKDEEEGYYLIAEFRGNGDRVGTCCAFPENGNFDIGYCIAKDHWKEGLGTEMIGALLQWIREQGGASVTCEVADENAASRALLRKFGFSQGRKSEYKKRGSERTFDAHFYTLTLAENR